MLYFFFKKKMSAEKGFGNSGSIPAPLELRQSTEYHCLQYFDKFLTCISM